MPANSSEIESRISAASAAMDANPRLKASVAARQFDAPVLEVVSTNDILGIWKAGNITAGWICEYYII